MKLRMTFAVLSVVVASLLLVGPATAAPANAKKASTLDLTCIGGITGTIEIVTNGNGDWTPGHVISNGHQTLIPYAFVFLFTTNGGQTFTEAISKPQPKNGRYALCAFGPISEEGGTIRGLVWVTYTPSH